MTLHLHSPGLSRGISLNREPCKVGMRVGLDLSQVPSPRNCVSLGPWGTWPLANTTKREILDGVGEGRVDCLWADLMSSHVFDFFPPYLSQLKTY